jgi:hypothetical protein
MESQAYQKGLEFHAIGACPQVEIHASAKDDFAGPRALEPCGMLSEEQPMGIATLNCGEDASPGHHEPPDFHPRKELKWTRHQVSTL